MFTLCFAFYKLEYCLTEIKRVPFPRKRAIPQDVQVLRMRNGRRLEGIWIKKMLVILRFGSSLILKGHKEPQSFLVRTNDLPLRSNLKRDGGGFWECTIRANAQRHQYTLIWAVIKILTAHWRLLSTLRHSMLLFRLHCSELGSAYEDAQRIGIKCTDIHRSHPNTWHECGWTKWEHFSLYVASLWAVPDRNLRSNKLHLPRENLLGLVYVCMLVCFL